MSKPSFSFYPDNWLHDLGLRRCGPFARAIWIDLICLMHQGEPYGHLSKSGENLPMPFIAGQCGVTVKQLKLAIGELDKNGVISKTEKGTIFSRRMVRDEDKRVARGAGGSLSLLNPNVPRRRIPGRIPSEDEQEGILPTGIGKGKNKKSSLLEDFGLFEAAAIEAGLPFSDRDMERAQYEWKSLDFEQKRDAIKGLKERKAAGEYDEARYRPLPQNYISEHMWQRPIRASPSCVEKPEKRPDPSQIL